MTKQKELYSSPKTEILVVRFEENIMSIGGANNGYNGVQGNNLGDLDD